MPTVAEFITTQFKKAGITPSAEVEDVLKNESLGKISLPDLVAKQVNDALMTVDVAKQNPILKQHFRAESLNPIDEAITKTYLNEYEIKDDLANAIINEKNTYEKISLLAKAIKQLEGKKATAATGDKAGYIQKIDELNASIVSLKNDAKTEKDRLLNESAQKELNWNIRGNFAGYNYSDQFDKSDAIELAIINLNKQLVADGAKVILKDGNLHLVNANDNALDFTRESQKVSFKEYADKLVADKKLIKTSEPPKPAPPGGNPPPPQPRNDNQPFNNAANDLLRDLEAAGVKVNQ